MTLTRRRFILIAAAAATVAGRRSEAPLVWRGHALGAEAQISIDAPRSIAGPALAAARDTIRRMEQLFSLYDPASALSRLNAAGALNMPSEFARLVARAGEIHALTGGLFDPSVQPLFAAMLSKGGSLAQSERAALQERIGWHNVDVAGNQIAFKRPDMALTFNGIAQGFATDRVVDVLRSHGIGHCLVNVGEYASIGRADMAIATQEGRFLADLQLVDQAVATSATSGFSFADGTGHVLHPAPNDSTPVWKTASVAARDATTADGISTALLLSPDEQLARSLLAHRVVSSVILERRNGQALHLA